MAYNVLSGTVNSALTTGSLTVAGTFVGDGTDLINTPGPNTVVPGTADDNRIITFTSTSGKIIQGETNLTFDGSALDVTGEITASVGVSASVYYGDGSSLTGITGGGGAGGIFTPVDGDEAYTTSSVKIGSTGAPNGALEVIGSTFLSGGMTHSRTLISGIYSASAADYFIGATSAAGEVEIFLDATLFLDGQTLVVKDEGGAASTNNITLVPSASQLIDGHASVVIESAYGSINVYTNGTGKWFVY